MKEERMICPSYNVCQSPFCRCKRPHDKRQECDNGVSSCPNCVSVTEKEDDLLLGATNGQL